MKYIIVGVRLSIVMIKDIYLVFFASYLGLYPAVLFVRYGVQANTVTVLSLLPLFAGLYAISVNYISIGTLFVFLWFLLDSTDGHIARFCGSVSKSGHFLDSLGAFFVYGLFFICASMSLSEYQFLSFGALTSVLYLLFTTITYLKKEVVGGSDSLTKSNESTLTHIVLYFVRFSGLPIPLLLLSNLTGLVGAFILFYFVLLLVVVVLYASKTYFELRGVDVTYD